jgi:hypothetical protein
MGGKVINFDDFKVRCSAIRKVLSNSQSNPLLTEKQQARMVELEEKLQKTGEITQKQQEELAELKVKQENGKKIILSDTCIEYLMEAYAWETEGMIPVSKESLDMLATKKGKVGEEEGLLLLSRVAKQLYKTHKTRIFNDYLSGEIDAYAGEHVYASSLISDIKNSWDYPIFLKKLHTGLEAGQKEQVQGYCDITNAPAGEIANTLINAPDDIIDEMKWKVLRKICAATTESPEFLEAWPKFEKSMRFDHMPIHKRVSRLPVEPFTAFEKQRLYDKVKICRDWLNIFHAQYEKLNKN